MKISSLVHWHWKRFNPVLAAVGRIADRLPAAGVNHEIHQFERDLADPDRAGIIDRGDVAAE